MMKNNNQVSIPVIKRLPRYHRYLEELKNMGVVRISSKELSSRMGLTASQIRQDLNCFGGFGQQGYGYNVDFLHKEIGNILDLVEKYVKTNIKFSDLKDYIPYAVNINMDTIQTEQLPGESKILNGIWFFLNDEEETKQVVNTLFSE